MAVEDAPEQKASEQEVIEQKSTDQSESSGEVFELVYEGPDVDTGSMSARELIDALAGLMKGFNTTSRERELPEKYELRVKDIDHASFHVILEAIAFTKANPIAAGVIVKGADVAIKAVNTWVSGAYKVITDLARVIEAKRKAKGERIATLPADFNDNGEVLLRTPDGSVVLTKEQYELLLSGRLDKELAKLISPLAAKRIERFLLRRARVDLAIVEAKDKGAFEYHKVPEDKSRDENEITGTLNSLSKNRLRGTFYTTEGIHVPYHYSGGDINRLLQSFASHERLRVRGKIRYGTDGIPTFIDVHEIELLQGRLAEGHL